MKESEILSDYRQAKNQRKQIGILADMCLCSKSEIGEILKKNGYMMVFNTNGVDISTKADEIKAKYENGTKIQELAKEYYAPQKGIKLILGLKEDEEMGKLTDIPEDIAKTNELNEALETSKKEIRDLKARIKELNEYITQLESDKTSNQHTIQALTEEIDQLNANLTKERESEWHKKYTDLCIRYNQASTTIDVLIDKISMLKVVGCHE